MSKLPTRDEALALLKEYNQEHLVIGSGVGFGKKVSERVEVRPKDTLYSLQEKTERGDARKLATSIQPVYLELANHVLDEAERIFQKIDRNVLFPLADHIEFAVKRLQKQENISNPLTDDIRILFHMEYNVACSLVSVLEERLGVRLDEDECSYIALHVHAAIQDENVSQAMQMARAVRECISYVEREIGTSIDVLSLSYNRLMNHVRNMVARAMKREPLKLNMNDYMMVKFPDAFRMAADVCTEVAKSLKCELGDVEIGYLAMHIARVIQDERENRTE